MVPNDSPLMTKELLVNNSTSISLEILTDLNWSFKLNLNVFVSTWKRATYSDKVTGGKIHLEYASLII